jgi:flagellar hook-associated protein 1 FlgK
MGLNVSLSNALSGMNATQRGLEVLSRNIANAGSPGYHRQALTLVDRNGQQSSYVNSVGVERAFVSALQVQFGQNVSSLGHADLRADYLARVEQALGRPGDVGSIGETYQNFENSLQALVTSPDDYAVRANVISTAQALVETLNRTTDTIQGLRQDSEIQIANHVSDLNRMLSSLEGINGELRDFSTQDTSRSALLDERDRLVSQISELVDARVEYRNDDTVALTTTSGLGLIDNGATVFEFFGVGGINATSQFSQDAAQNGVGSLRAITPSGYAIDVVEQGMVRSGRLGALIEMRDTTLVELQAQIDDIAAGLAQSLSSVSTDADVVSGPPDGFSLDLANMQAGNDFTLSYSVGGVEQNVRVVRVDDPANLPMDTIGANGERVIGLDFSAGIGAVASALDVALGPAITVSNPAGTTIQIVDDGAANTSDISSMASKTTVSANQGAGLALSLFTDQNSLSFTNSLDGRGQRVGFAGRISINQDVLNNNQLLVQHVSGASLGDNSRAEMLLSQLEGMSFTSENVTSSTSGSFRLNGSAQDMIAQMLNYQGSEIAAANSTKQTREFSLEAINIRMSEEYGVNIDEEMARLMELQNAYAASARVVSIVQDLLQTLMQI